jgi:glycosyltransferase involved in cell wall biosynthesis
MNRLAASFTNRIVAYTRDYADHSPYLSSYPNKLEVINPPVVMPEISVEAIAQFKKDHNPRDNHPVIGMAARFATEKGVEVLLNASEEILRDFPQAEFWFAGPYENIMGEQHYFERLRPRIEALQQAGHWKFLGLLSPEVMAAFYPNLDILTIPSLNSTESFGLVQIEAMMNGVPVISSNLPGVRQPVLRHQMGRVIPIGDSKSLAQAVRELVEEKKDYGDRKAVIREMYAPDTIAQKYEDLFKRIQDEIQ